MKIWKQTETIDDYIGDLELAKTENEADIVLTGGKTVKIDNFPNLKGIFRCGVTKTGLPFTEASKRGIEIGFPSEETAEYIFEETADFTCFLIFKMIYKKIGSIDPWIKLPRRALSNQILLVIGMGKIGSKVFEKIGNFMNVSCFDLKNDSDDNLEKLINLADVITLHIPSTAENHDFFDKERLSYMKDDAILINTARGKIVSEDALYEEIMSKRLSAAFDVFWEEPYNGKLTEFYPDRFYMTPHTASTSKEFLDGTAKDFMKFYSMLGEKKND